MYLDIFTCVKCVIINLPTFLSETGNEYDITAYILNVIPMP